MCMITLGDIKKAQQLWADAIVSKDIESLMKLYAENSILKPTLSPMIRKAHRDIREYFVGGQKFNDYGFMNNGFRKVEFIESVPLIMENIAIDIGQYRFIKKDGYNIAAHYTFCYLKRQSGTLLIFAQHSSKGGYGVKT